MPPPISPSVDAAPQPVSVVRTMPSTSSDRPTVAVTAPARSKLRVRSGLRPSATSRWVASAAAIPIGNVDEQNPAPIERVGEHAAEQHTGGAARSAHRTPDADGAVAGRALGEGGGEDRQRRGGDHRAAETLDRPSGDQHALAARQPAGQRGEREQHQTGDEHSPAPEQIGGAAAQQQEARERDRVGVDDPLQVLLGEVQAPADRGQRNVDDLDVENHHELRQAGQDQCCGEMRALLGAGGVAHEPPSTFGVRWSSNRTGSKMFDDRRTMGRHEHAQS